MMLLPITIVAILSFVSAGNPVPDALVDHQHKTGNAQTDFMTYAQHQMNPSNEDYGQKLHLASALLFQQTLGNAYFWLTAISLAISALLLWFISFLFEQRQRRELISAKYLAWYHNELVCLRKSIESKSSMSTSDSALVHAEEARKNETADQLAELSRLRQQITSQEATERVLREQINSLSKKLSEEKQRNKSVKVP